MNAQIAGMLFKMLFVGGGEEFDEITAFAGSIGLGDECIFTGPVRDREKMKALGLKAMDELYLSWDTAVGAAVQRYREVIDRYKNSRHDRVE